MKTKYVLGFLFNSSGMSVVLVIKNKPAWQAGKLNGCGGKIEDRESPATAMTREGLEEIGCRIKWTHFATMEGIDWQVFCFKMFDTTAYESAKTMTDEPVVKIPVIRLPYEKHIDNISWLIAMARDTGFIATVKYD